MSQRYPYGKGPTPPNVLDAILGSRTGAPLRRALKLEQLDSQLRPFLPGRTGEHCRLANINEDALVYVVDSPVWHAKLRLSERALIAAARSAGLAVTHLKVKTDKEVLMRKAQTEPKPTSPVKTSTHRGIAEALSALADVLEPRKP